jgi:hypothetical protein
LIALISILLIRDPVAAASSFVLPATLLLVYVVTAVLVALDGAAKAFSVAGVVWLMAIQIGLVAPLTVAGAFAAKAVACTRTSNATSASSRARRGDGAPARPSLSASLAMIGSGSPGRSWMRTMLMRPLSSDMGKGENNEPARTLGTNAAPQEDSLAKQKGELILYLVAAGEPGQGKGRNDPSSLESFLSTPINHHKVTVVSLNKHMQPR